MKLNGVLIVEMVWWDAMYCFWDCFWDVMEHVIIGIFGDILMHVIDFIDFA